MKERPILFSAPMVRAILEGRKTQTRRVVSKSTLFGDKTQEADGYCPTILEPNAVGNVKWQWAKGAYFASHPHLLPYGQPGDRLWVRETWCDPGRSGWPILYRADFPQHWSAKNSSTGSSVTLKAEDYQWKPSIHMFRDFSRIPLEVTGVRVERLQDIGDADARAEGVEELRPGLWRDYLSEERAAYWTDARASYESLWESINGPGSWDANPWVWVVEFKRVKP